MLVADPAVSLTYKSPIIVGVVKYVSVNEFCNPDPVNVISLLLTFAAKISFKVVLIVPVKVIRLSDVVLKDGSSNKAFISVVVNVSPASIFADNKVSSETLSA